jgi:hypothetical protein
MSTPDPVASLGDQILPPATFVARFPHLYRSVHALRWVLRDRALNGLNDYAAVLEVWPAGEGGGKRGPQPRLYVNVPNWFRWMQAGGARAPRLHAQGRP